MKIIVPQELQQQIVNLYLAGKNRKQIKVQLDLPFGDSVIKRILIENNCEIQTNPGAQKGGRKKEEVSQEIQNKIIDLYNQGFGLNSIVSKIKGEFCADKVKRILKDNNIVLRNFAEAIEVKPNADTRKYKINDDYNFESHNGAWLLGFLTADGYLPNTKSAKYRITIALARIDEEILYMIKKELGYEGPIYQYNSVEGYPFSSLSFTSKKLRQKIESYGIVNNKTFKIHKLPNILSQEYMIDFIRGFFDGDGSIFEREEEKKVRMNFICASNSFLEEIGTFLHSTLDVAKPQIHSSMRTHEIYDIQYYKKDSFILGEKFYNHNYLALPRKKQKYFYLKEKYFH